MTTIFEMLGAAFFLVVSLMSLCFLFYYFKKNAGIADLGWALSFCLAAWAYFFIGYGYSPKKWVMTSMATMWSLRLTWHLFRRYRTSDEDPRYQELRKTWGKTAGENMQFFMMFMFQAVLAILLSLPFLFVSAWATVGWQGIEILGILFWLIGIVGETFADQQLFQFKQNPSNRAQVCQEGLWFYSRHPNYFFEFIVWIGFFFFALGTDGGWLSILSPALMLLLLTQVSGIPVSEEQARKSKGAPYQEYQKTTSSFIPWFK